MIQRQLKLRLTSRQERQLTDWLWHLTGVWNWAIRKLELDARDGIYYSSKGFHNLLANHGKTLGIPSHTLQGMLSTAYTAWQRCVKKLSRRPRLKGQRNKLTSIPFPDPFRLPEDNTMFLPGVGRVRFHAQAVPAGQIKSGGVVKRASGWYLCLFIDAAPQIIPHVEDGLVGIDPGFRHLLTLSTGEKVPHPRELERTAHRLAQAQRGGRKQLAARLHDGLPINGKIGTISSLGDLSLKISGWCGPKTDTPRWQNRLGRALPVPDMRNFEPCLPTSALPAVGSISKSRHIPPPRPAQHVGASPVPLAMPACRSGNGCVLYVGQRMTAM